jgi:hypothetical protein
MTLYNLHGVLGALYVFTPYDDIEPYNVGSLFKAA